MAINPFLVLNNSFIIALKIKQMKMLLLMTGILLHVKFYLPLLLDATHLTIPYHTGTDVYDCIQGCESVV